MKKHTTDYSKFDALMQQQKEEEDEEEATSGSRAVAQSESRNHEIHFRLPMTRIASSWVTSAPEFPQSFPAWLCFRFSEVLLVLQNGGAIQGLGRACVPGACLRACVPGGAVPLGCAGAAAAQGDAGLQGASVPPACAKPNGP